LLLCDIQNPEKYNTKLSRMVGVPGKFFAILSGADGSVTVCGSVAKEMPGDLSGYSLSLPRCHAEP
jgi:hypothetical protein